MVIVMLGEVLVLVLLPAFCLGQTSDSHKYRATTTLWPEDQALIQQLTVPSRIRCGAWCSSLGDECSVYEFQPDTRTCQVARQVLVTSVQQLASTLPSRKMAMARRTDSKMVSKIPDAGLIDVLGNQPKMHTAWRLFLNVRRG